MPPVLSQVPQPAEGLYVPEPPSRLHTGERRADERGFADPTLILSSTPELSRWPVRDPSQGRMRRLLPSPPPQKSAAWPTRLLHGVLRGSRSAGGGVWPSLKPVGAAAALRAHGQSGYFLSASAVSAPPYGKPCSKRGRPKLDSKLGRNAAH